MQDERNYSPATIEQRPPQEVSSQQPEYNPVASSEQGTIYANRQGQTFVGVASSEKGTLLQNTEQQQQGIIPVASSNEGTLFAQLGDKSGKAYLPVASSNQGVLYQDVTPQPPLPLSKQVLPEIDVNEKTMYLNEQARRNIISFGEKVNELANTISDNPTNESQRMVSPEFQGVGKFFKGGIQAVGSNIEAFGYNPHGYVKQYVGDPLALGLATAVAFEFVAPAVPVLLAETGFLGETAAITTGRVLEAGAITAFTTELGVTTFGRSAQEQRPDVLFGVAGAALGANMISDSGLAKKVPDLVKTEFSSVRSANARTIDTARLLADVRPSDITTNKAVIDFVLNKPQQETINGHPVFDIPEENVDLFGMNKRGEVRSFSQGGKPSKAQLRKASQSGQSIEQLRSSGGKNRAYDGLSYVKDVKGQQSELNYLIPEKTNYKQLQFKEQVTFRANDLELSTPNYNPKSSNLFEKYKPSVPVSQKVMFGFESKNVPVGVSPEMRVSKRNLLGKESVVVSKKIGTEIVLRPARVEKGFASYDVETGKISTKDYYKGLSISKQPVFETKEYFKNNDKQFSSEETKTITGGNINSVVKQNSILNFKSIPQPKFQPRFVEKSAGVPSHATTKLIGDMKRGEYIPIASVEYPKTINRNAGEKVFTKREARLEELKKNLVAKRQAELAGQQLVVVPEDYGLVPNTKTSSSIYSTTKHPYAENALALFGGESKSLGTATNIGDGIFSRKKVKPVVFSYGGEQVTPSPSILDAKPIGISSNEAQSYGERIGSRDKSIPSLYFASKQEQDQKQRLKLAVLLENKSELSKSMSLMAKGKVNVDNAVNLRQNISVGQESVQKNVQRLVQDQGLVTEQIITPFNTVNQRPSPEIPEIKPIGTFVPPHIDMKNPPPQPRPVTPETPFNKVPPVTNRNLLFGIPFVDVGKRQPEYLVEVGRPGNKYFFKLGKGSTDLVLKARGLAKNTAAASIRVTGSKGERVDVSRLLGSGFKERNGYYVQATVDRISSSGEKQQIPGEAARRKRLSTTTNYGLALSKVKQGVPLRKVRSFL